MGFISVKLIFNDKTYSLEVDENADPKALTQGIVESLGLSTKGKQYQLHLVDALRIHEGATLELVETKPNSLLRGLKEDKSK